MFAMSSKTSGKNSGWAQVAAAFLAREIELTISFGPFVLEHVLKIKAASSGRSAYPTALRQPCKANPCASIRAA